MLKPNTLKRKFFQSSVIIFVVSLFFLVFLHYNIEERQKDFFENPKIEIPVEDTGSSGSSGWIKVHNFIWTM